MIGYGLVRYGMVLWGLAWYKMLFSYLQEPRGTGQVAGGGGPGLQGGGRVIPLLHGGAGPALCGHGGA